MFVISLYTFFQLLIAQTIALTLYRPLILSGLKNSSVTKKSARYSLHWHSTWRHRAMQFANTEEDPHR